MDKSSWSSCTFELEDIEIIDHKNEKEEDPGMWSCDQCSLFFLEQGKLNEHKKTHIVQNVVRCKYCDKTISMSEVNRECFLNRKCETCEYKCSKCPQRFLRHSSLVNHEKKHASPKKKRILPGNRKVNYVCPDKVAVLSKGVKRKQSKAFDSEEQREGLKKIKRNMNMNNSPKKKFNTKIKAQESSGFGENSAIKPPKRMSLKADKVEVKKNCENSPVKENKRASLKSNKILEENLSPNKSKQNSASVNLQAGPPTANVSSSENVVNYKPFSCHVCGDTFASDGALLSHIKTHGESAAKSFKCKFCGDEFDDIYKMQYHLAICPLAEDELEISLKQVIPVNVSTTFSGGTSSPRKRGRPKKVEPPLNQESCTENEPTQPSVKMGKSRKRKSGVLENASQTEPSSKQSKKSLNEETLTASNNNIDAGENVNNTLSSNVTEVTGEVELDEDKKKLHRCPFPRCDFKFTREKALLCHMRNHSDDLDDSLKCHKCDIPFDDVHTLRLHINTCKGIKEEKDDDFNRAGPYDSSPNRTFQRAMKKDFVCNQCGKSHHSQDKLDSHQCNGFETDRLVKKALRRHKCNVCQAEFNSEIEENDHLVTHIRKVAERHCLRCYNYFKETYIQQHKCEIRIKSARALVELSLQKKPTSKHLVQMFDGTKPKSSETNRRQNVLSNKIKAEESFLKHRKSHEIKRILCSHCNRQFFSQKKLKRHHCKRETQLSKCSICSKEYLDRTSLTEHLNVDHVKDMKNFECEICNITICDASSFIDHLMFHTFSCSNDNDGPNNLDSEIRIDSPEDCKITRKEIVPSTKIGFSPSFHRKRMFATFAISKTKYRRGFKNGVRGKGNHVTTRLQAEKCQETLKTENLLNKENIPENSLVTENSSSNISLNSLTTKYGHTIKPCFIPLVNMRIEITDNLNTENTTSISPDHSIVSDSNKKDKMSEENFAGPMQRNLKLEKDLNVISVEEDLKFNFFKDNKCSETNLNNAEVGECVNHSNSDIDDGVIITVHKCYICLQVFDSVELLKMHVYVHM